MEPIICKHCGTSIRVTTADDPIYEREDPATELAPRQFVILSRDWLLHRCEIPEEVESKA